MAAKTDTTPYNGHRPLYIAGFISAVLLFCIGVWLAHYRRFTGWEVTWFFFVNEWPDKWRTIALVITSLGSTWAAVGSVIASFAARMYRLAWRLSLSIIGGYGVVFFAKHFLDRPRPEGLLDETSVRVLESGAGFPSGHATAITIIMLTLLPYMPWRWRWIVPLLIVLVALSRLYLGVHVPLDVIGGVALGTTVVCFVRILPQSLRVFLRID